MLQSPSFLQVLVCMLKSVAANWRWCKCADPDGWCQLKGGIWSKEKASNGGQVASQGMPCHWQASTGKLSQLPQSFHKSPLAWTFLYPFELIISLTRRLKIDEFRVAFLHGHGSFVNRLKKPACLQKASISLCTFYTDDTNTIYDVVGMMVGEPNHF
jgi:hypothetical protein